MNLYRDEHRNLCYQGRDRVQDLVLIAKSFYDRLYFEDRCGYGNWQGDATRPFGSSYVVRDLFEILNIENEITESGEDVEDTDFLDYVEDLYKVQLGPFMVECWEDWCRTNGHMEDE